MTATRRRRAAGLVALALCLATVAAACRGRFSYAVGPDRQVIPAAP